MGVRRGRRGSLPVPRSGQRGLAAPHTAPLRAAPRPGRTSSWPSSVQACSLKCVMLMAVMTCPFLLESHAQWGKMISL